MSGAVSIVLPALDTPGLLEANLPALLEECERRACGDEVLVVDDTGEDVLASLLAGPFPGVRVVARPENGGFARALLSGVEAARHALVFSMNTDVRVRPGFLAPLVAALEDEHVLAVTPRVLLDGREDAVESCTELELEDGLPHLARADEDRLPSTPVPVPFAVGGTCLFRRDELLGRGGLDPLFEPFYLEDLDWCWEGWARGRRVLLVPASVVEHHHRGTIGARVPGDVVRAAIERNLLLFTWKHLDDPALLGEHFAALLGSATSAWIEGDRDRLVWLALALEEVDRALAARRARGPVARGFAAIAAISRDRGGLD